MNLEFMRSELERAEEAELQSEEQLRQLVGHIDKVCAPNSTLDASDCAKTARPQNQVTASCQSRRPHKSQRGNDGQVQSRPPTVTPTKKCQSKAYKAGAGKSESQTYATQ
jgi:hypothetical protein